MKRILVAMVIFLPLLAAGQTTVLNIDWECTPPATGTPAVLYQWDLSTDGGQTWAAAASTPLPAATIPMPAGMAGIVRVRALDAAGRPGPYGTPSDPYTPDAGPPGACGKPRRR